MPTRMTWAVDGAGVRARAPHYGDESSLRRGYKGLLALETTECSICACGGGFYGFLLDGMYGSESLCASIVFKYECEASQCMNM